MGYSKRIDHREILLRMATIPFSLVIIQANDVFLKEEMDIIFF